MAIGDTVDLFGRIRRLLPRWFGQDVAPTPVLDSILAGYAWALNLVYSLWDYARLQTRILTATDGWLDLIAADFFGTSLQRNQNEGDDHFRARIIANLFEERATRRAVYNIVLALTGYAPRIFEFLRPSDTGGYGEPTSMGYGLAGGYGSFAMPYQAFINVRRPVNSGIPYVSGYGSPAAGYGVASRGEYASLDDVVGNVTDADIYAAIDSVRPVATTLWVNIQ